MVPGMDDLTPASGLELAELRRSYGLSQLALARQLGISQSTLTRWEARDRVPAIKAGRYRRAADVAARRAMLGTADLTVVPA